MKANELEELQEEAQASYHQGDYSTTITVLERVIEVCVRQWELHTVLSNREKSIIVCHV